MMKPQTPPVSSVRRANRGRRHASVLRFAAWQRRTPPSTLVLTRLIRLLAR
jgi:hypothetical protein